MSLTSYLWGIIASSVNTAVSVAQSTASSVISNVIDFTSLLQPLWTMLYNILALVTQIVVYPFALIIMALWGDLNILWSLFAAFVNIFLSFPNFIYQLYNMWFGIHVPTIWFFLLLLMLTLNISFTALMWIRFAWSQVPIIGGH